MLVRFNFFFCKLFLNVNIPFSLVKTDVWNNPPYSNVTFTGKSFSTCVIGLRTTGGSFGGWL